MGWGILTIRNFFNIMTIGYRPKGCANYKKKVVTVRVELYGTDEDIQKFVEKLKNEGVSVQG